MNAPRNAVAVARTGPHRVGYAAGARARRVLGARFAGDVDRVNLPVDVGGVAATP